MSAPKTISGHLLDLGKRDIMVAYDCVQWLAPTQREIDRRARPKRLANRYIAACMIVGAAENPAFCRELLDRTEGKVAELVITGSIGELVAALEAGRERLLQARPQPLALPAPQDVVVEGELASPEDPLPVSIPTDSDTSK